MSTPRNTARRLPGGRNTRQLLTAAAAILGAAGTAALTACGDAPTAPAAGASAPRLAVTAAGDTTITTFTYQPAAALRQQVGSHIIEFPAGAVCDPASSGYGPGAWDAPCAALTQAITFTARTWTDAAGHPRIHVSPDVRFVPRSVVTLYAYDKQAALDPKFRYKWCPSGGGACVDEAASDPAVATYRDPGKFYLYGRIKHFSGYNIMAD